MEWNEQVISFNQRISSDAACSYQNKLILKSLLPLFRTDMSWTDWVTSYTMSVSESIQQFVLHQYSSSLCLINLMKKKIVKVLKWFAWNNLDKNFKLATANFLLLLLMQTGFTTFLVKKGKTCFEQEENHESSSHRGWTKKLFLEEALNEWQFEF